MLLGKAEGGTILNTNWKDSSPIDLNISQCFRWVKMIQLPLRAYLSRPIIFSYGNPISMLGHEGCYTNSNRECSGFENA